MNAMMQIRLANQNDIDRIVDVHMCAFPGYFLSRLGRSIVWRLYSEYLLCADGAISIIGGVDDSVKGFVVGTYPGGVNVGKTFYRNNFYRVAVAVFFALLRADRIIWSGLWWRLRRIKSAVRARFGAKEKNGRSEPRMALGAVRVGWLVSIATLPDARGLGLASGMVEAFEREQALHGVNRVMLCAYKDNARAIAFYKKMNYRQTNESGQLLFFEKDI